MAITATDVSVALNGNIRWTGGAVSATQYSVLELHRFLQDLADDAQASGDDLVDISSSTPSERSTDAIITLNGTYNIDDTMAQHLYGGSITQSSGDTVYSGLQVVGSLFSGTTRLQIIQNKQVLPNYWGAGLNVDATANVLCRVLVKTRSGGNDIDGKRIRVQAREYGTTYAEFSATLGLGEGVAAIFQNEDINNTTATSTIETWTTMGNVAEGYQTINLGNGDGLQPYYSQWNKATYTINQMYERAKWYQQRAHVDDTGAGSGKDNPVGNGTITRQGQSFTVGPNAMYLRRARFKLKIGAGTPTGNITAVLYAHSGSYGTSSVGTGAALATSENIPASRIRSSYDELEFVFNTPYEMTAATNYVIAVVYSAGDVSNYVAVQGSDTSSHDGNRASFDGSWTADSSDDLYFSVLDSPKIYGMPGELFRGITHQFNYDGASGNLTQNEELTWGSGATAGTAVLLADKDDGTSGTLWIQLTSGVPPTDPMTITGVTSTKTVDINGSVTARTLSPVFIGQSTGTALIGAFGIGFEAADVTYTDKLFDLNNTQRIPPNNVTWTMSGIVSGHDYVLVGPESGDDFVWNQLTLNTTLNGGSETAVVCTTAIPTDTPASGTIRIELDSGIRRKISYLSYTSATFTIASTDFSGANAATANNDIMISYIDKLADASTATFDSKFSSTRPLRFRIRDGGASPIKTNEGNSSLTSAGGGASATRTSDA